MCSPFVNERVHGGPQYPTNRKYACMEFTYDVCLTHQARPNIVIHVTQLSLDHVDWSVRNKAIEHIVRVEYLVNY